MILNSLMKNILKCVEYDKIPSCAEYPIRQNTSYNGEPFWSVGDFCGLLDAGIKGQYELTELEWNGNEIYINHSSNILELVTYSLGILKDWKAQMEIYYGEVPVDIILSVDYGDEDIPPSVTLRFWAIRNQIHYVNPTATELEKFCQPVLMEQVNYTI